MSSMHIEENCIPPLKTKYDRNYNSQIVISRNQPKQLTTIAIASFSDYDDIVA